MFFMLCSIFFFMFLAYVWVSFSHLSCTCHASSFILVHILFSFPPSPWLICLFVTKMGSNSTSCTFVRGEIHRGDAYIKGEKTFFYEKTLLCLVLLYACFLVALWCFELCLVSILYCSHHIMLMCWKCIYSYTIVLYWLHIQIIICFAIWSL